MASSAWPSNTTCQQRVKREAEVSVKPLDETWTWSNVMEKPHFNLIQSERMLINAN